MTEVTETPIDAQMLFGVGIALIFAGMLIVLATFLSFFFANAKAKGEGKSRGGGVIIIGPIPIIFGTDKETLKTVLLLSLALTIVVVIAIVVFHLLLR